jgi:hypothetical protein
MANMLRNMEIKRDSRLFRLQSRRVDVFPQAVIFGAVHHYARLQEAKGPTIIPNGYLEGIRWSNVSVGA